MPKNSIFDQFESKQTMLKKDIKKDIKKDFLKDSLKKIGVGAKRVKESFVSPEKTAFKKELKEKTQAAFKKELLKQHIKESKKKARNLVQKKKMKQNELMDKLLRL